MKQEEHPFVTYLERLHQDKDRAALAKLRRGLGKRMGSPEMYPYVVPFLPENERAREHHFLVASLFAMHPDPAPPGQSMGAVFRAIRRETESESIEKRFVNLLSADGEDVGKYLRQAISLARSKGVAINYHRLLYDLRFWDHPDRFVQLQWAKDYWGFEKQISSETGKGEN
jgi:CRISPR system Cascade subunit CasB